MTGAARAMERGTVERRIFAAAFVIAAMTAAGKFVALLKEVLVASMFGTGDELDAFLLAFVLPSFTISVIAGSFGVALVPSYVRALHDRERAQRLLSGAAN